MKLSAHFGTRRILAGWGAFVVGLLLLLWMHTLRDSAAHSAILPFLLLLWIILAMAVWDGCKGITPWLRFVFLLLHAVSGRSKPASDGRIKTSHS
jgi:peptidoglycan/LPS O-acetylase OafA/YrhL